MGWQFGNVSQSPQCTFGLTQQFYFQEGTQPSDALWGEHKDICTRVFTSASIPTTKRWETSQISIKKVLLHCDTPTPWCFILPLKLARGFCVQHYRKMCCQKNRVTKHYIQFDAIHAKHTHIHALHMHTCMWICMENSGNWDRSLLTVVIFGEWNRKVRGEGFYLKTYAPLFDNLTKQI